MSLSTTYMISLTILLYVVIYRQNLSLMCRNNNIKSAIAAFISFHIVDNDNSN